MFLMESSETMDDAGEAQGASSLLKRRDVPNDDDGTAEPSEKRPLCGPCYESRYSLAWWLRGFH